MNELYLSMYGGEDQTQQKTAIDSFPIVLYSNGYIQPNSRTFSSENGNCGFAPIIQCKHISHSSLTERGPNNMGYF